MCGPPQRRLGAFIFIVLLTAKGCCSLYFTQDNYQEEISTDFEAGRNIIKVYALLENEKYRKSNGTIYQIQSTLKCGQRIEEGSVFHINRSTGWISLTKSLEPVSAIDHERCFLLTVLATSGNESDVTTVRITVISTNRKPPCNIAKTEDVERICFRNGVFKWTVAENNRPGSSIGTVQSVFYGQCPDLVKRYEALDGNSHEPHQDIEIGKKSAELFTKVSLDRERMRKPARIHFLVKCHVVSFGRTINVSKAGVLEVLDVNDNGPVIMKFQARKRQLRRDDTKTVLVKDPSDIKVDGKLTDMIVKDEDSNEEKFKDYKIYIANDPLGQFRMGAGQPMSSFLKSAVKWNRSLVITDSEYQFDVVFNDTTETFGNTTAVFHIIVKLPFHTRDSSMDWFQGSRTLSVSRNASAYSRVLNLYEGSTPDPNWTFGIVHTSHKPQPFGVTSPSGIVYVINRTLLANTPAKQLNLTVELKNNNTATTGSRVHLIVNIYESKELCLGDEESCSFQKSPENCTNACGFGSPTGDCVFKPGADLGLVSTKGYGTCTPDVRTCPDGVCDELERLQPHLCLQDCVRFKVIGGTLAQGAQGIRVSDTMDCFCRPNMQCECAESSYNLTLVTLRMPKHVKAEPPLTPPSKANVKVNETKLVDKYKYVAAPVMLKNSQNECGQLCKVGITIGVGGTFLMVLLAGILKHFIAKRPQRKRKLKHANSMISVSAVPSDYVSDSERRPSNNTILDGGHPQELQWLGPQIPKGVIDSKWEFSRDDLILEKTLGEGEFGRVLKAQAFSLDGKRGSVTVAVKMLKNCATNSELRDLLSEYQLLKEVSHPNVIKLLGACTDLGPFYMIVEFCEHGSLRNYLRESREKDSLYLQDKRSVTSESILQTEIQIGQDTGDDVVTARDLISFAWQIAKGMQYLSEMKVVHRDLAARNILVSVGKILKISDFGLSRDVYEEDTYTKRSRGRVPVKWMAPESLYDHIYTTKSDVWSYGIVLWEIVTLGATPYPGIPPERLFNLLKTGYRMSLPSNCSEELYHIMSRCWAEEPTSRPEFKELENIFDKMLQENVDYLDLSNTVEQNPIVDDDQDSSRVNGIGRLDVVPRVTTEDDYGSIHVVPMDDSAYLQPQSANRNNNTKYFTLLANSNRLGLVCNGTSPKKSRRSEELCNHSLLADNVLYSISDSEDTDGDAWERNTLVQVKTKRNSLPEGDGESVGGDSIRSTVV
ncbi:proto-oncogene tyrosine-protein kinase receptor Ret-like [Lingula anatina]|uniref:receptor protein-tyrosine kinase n=1 Tax=Lingula anatina TaxID=7574 RepID=A0A1S3H9Z7_LINAN|nr:proto-oncogene tyrosine-protein kinase receptor Ret-like [Lingula anatina]|eukprot:XP_013381944.1 proto-oncogene tyrosine-protein kinase receptor Ret-like [Lingula anatina]